MKKGNCIATAIFNFLFAAVMLALVPFFLRMFVIVFINLSDLGSRLWAIWLLLIIFFFILIFIIIFLLIIIFLPLIIALINTVIAGLNIAAGIMIIKGVKNAKVKNVVQFSLLSLIANIIFATLTAFIIPVTVSSLNTASTAGATIAILYIAAFILSLISIILNTVCYCNANQNK